MRLTTLLAGAGLISCATTTSKLLICPRRIQSASFIELVEAQCRKNKAYDFSLQKYVPRLASPNDKISHWTLTAITPGDFVQNYQLIERTAILGTCGHDAFEQEETSVVKINNKPAATRQFAHKQLSDGRKNEENEDALLLEGPSLEYQCSIEDIDLIYVNQHYRLRKKFDGGSHGEVWRAVRVSDDGSHSDESFILKRIFVELGEDTHLSGLREAHFGAQLQGEPHVTRFVEAFYRDASNSTASELQELWLVFYDEGISLRHYMYTKTRSLSSVLFEPSLFWERMRVEEEGALVLKEMVRQLIEGVAALHDRGITHRDIKPSNILISKDTQFAVKLADLGSAVDEHTHHYLYGTKGPSQAEETREYQPPEVLFHGDVPYDYANPTSYDMWSVGVVFLELILGSPHVFSISSRARAKVDARLHDKSEAVRSKSYLLHVFTEFCIFQPPSLHRYHQDYALVHSACNFGTFNTTIQQRDPLGIGFQDSWGLHLLWKLLQWDPEKRITARDALNHAYFQGPYVCSESQRAFPTLQELKLHQAFLESKRAAKRDTFIQRIYELPTEFYCSCGRVFSSIDACIRHLHARQHTTHGAFCHYSALPVRQQLQQQQATEIDTETNLPYGHAMFSGRRKYMEDMFVVESNPALEYDLYAVLDGHMGTGAAQFVRQHLGAIFASHYRDARDKAQDDDGDAHLLEELALRQTFSDLHGQFIAQANESDFSGTTLTVVVHFPHENRLAIANVGDSRAVLYGDLNGTQTPKNIFALTKDHSPNDLEERQRIESSGGFVSFIGVWRVMGQLAVSRTLGDKHMSQYTSCDPTVSHVTLNSSAAFLVLASDGVWEALDNVQVGTFVAERLHDDMTQVAQDVVIEAFVRGSSDNLFAMVVDLRA
ncbi:unnamed protein product [Aphanomyces euteiches]|uniref:Uncharacterized protein n=1 Tax=Aphanomyces euteiches TaxID=100861 RepID=A0A6G0W433_9STRA|nr:hypothetical protein Ae201684_018827 [Aphanomyces euteiches]KAH9061655.1 hypothetical protein Ae201684P_020990 [Aphanomyces euteiches]KAH9155535.1 hypothetical protein AeRB84_002497 [Aphanomyces euteiches]